MVARISSIICLVLFTAIPALAGENPSAKLAMHVVASSEYLDCGDLMPGACDSINVDVSLSEILTARGYGYVALLAYDIEGITAVEFAVHGWPTGRGAPVLNGPYWCIEGTQTYGNPLGSGAATSLGSCVEPSGNGIVLLAYLSFGPLDEEDLPITLRFVPSTFTQPEDSLLGVTDCTEMYEIDEVVVTSGCTIGGMYTGTMPECVGILGGEGEGEEAGEEAEGQEFQWPVVVETGILYVYGNRLEPPYVFTFENEQMFVNGARLIPKLGRQLPLPARQAPEWYQEAHALNERALDLARALLGQQVPSDSIAGAWAELYRSSPLVDSVEVGEQDLVIFYVGDHYPLWASVPRDIPAPSPPPSQDEVCRRIVSRLAFSLQPGWVVFYGVGYEVAMSAGAAAADLETLQETGDPNADNLQLLRGEVGRDLLDPIPLGGH